MPEVVEDLRCFAISLPRDVPYLGPLRGEVVSEKNYFVRPGNRVVYSTNDQFVLVRAVTSSGYVGWGEAFGMIVPSAVVEILREAVFPIVRGWPVHELVSCHDVLYDAMRTRGAHSGYWLDALAAIDIALWDARARVLGLPLWMLLGGREREHVPVYVSGLPKQDLEGRVAEAVAWQERGFDSVKFAAVVAYEGVLEEARTLRRELGPDANIVVDLHWAYGEAEALAIGHELASLDIGFMEAPLAPEDIDGLRRLARRSRVPIAAGEEWRTAYESAPRLAHADVSIVQPEMGRTGITEFLRIAEVARSFHRKVAPHGTSGVGLFLAASLHVSLTLRNLLIHEYQHSIVDLNNKWLTTPLVAQAGTMQVPDGLGLGVKPRDELFKYIVAGDAFTA